MALQIAQASILREKIFKYNKTVGINLTYRRSSLLNYAFVCSLIATSETSSVAGRFNRSVMRWSAEDVTGYDEPAHIHHRRPAQCMPVRFWPVCQCPISILNEIGSISFCTCATKLCPFFVFTLNGEIFFLTFPLLKINM